jgi:hypothetical protein
MKDGWKVVTKTVFCWVPVPHVTMVVNLSCFFNHLPTKNPTFGLVVGR